MTDYSTAIIDTANPITSGLVRAVGGNRLQDIVSGATLSTVGTVNNTVNGFTFGSSSAIVLPDTPLGEFTVFAWAFCSGSTNCLVSRCSDGANDYRQNYDLRLINGTQVQGRLREEGTTNYINTTADINYGTTGTLIKAAFSYNASTDVSKVYVDGAVQTPRGGVSDPYTSNSTGVLTLIGATDGSEYAIPYNGNGIQLVLIWNRALSDAEVADLSADPDQVFDLTPGTAPTLTSPTASATSPTTSTGSVSTDQANGTLYWLTNTSSTATATAVKAGSSQSVTTTGAQTTTSSSLTASTTYYTHFLHRNAGGLDSAVVTSASFTTPAPAVPPTMNGSITVGTKTSGSISISYPAASDPVGVTGYEVSKDGTTWLDNGTSLSYTFLGLVPLTSYTLSVRAYNAAGLRASPALSVTTSTYREGATGQYIKDNTGPQDGNPEGILYDDVDLSGDANKWFSYRVTTPPVDPDAITLNPDGSFIFTGLVADSFYYQLEVDGEDVGVPQPVTLTTDDPTPPVLSDPTGVATSPTTASGTVVTNESGGTLYFVTTQNATESGTTVKAGASQTVTASGLQSVSSTSLTGATTYYNHYLHRGATGNDSLVVSSAAFTTPAVPPDPPVLSSPTATTTSATTASGTVSTTSSTGTLFILVSTNNAVTDAAFWASTSKQSQPVTATGVQTVPLTALSPSTTYTAYYGQIDSLSNQSNVVKSAQFTTDAAPPSTGSKQLNISLRIGFGL